MQSGMDKSVSLRHRLLAYPLLAMCHAELGDIAKAQDDMNRSADGLRKWNLAFRRSQHARLTRDSPLDWLVALALHHRARVQLDGLEAADAELSQFVVSEDETTDSAPNK